MDIAMRNKTVHVYNKKDMNDTRSKFGDYGTGEEA
jgi:hypothetical protein